jgi:ProP effector
MLGAFLTASKNRFTMNKTPQDSPTAPADSPGQTARALLKTLQESFPVFRDYSPLAIGIDKELLASRPEIDRKVLRIALGMHSHSLRYLKTMEKATHRLHLDGSVGDEVAPAHRAHATETLRERFRKDAERRKAQRDAEAKAARELRAQAEAAAQENLRAQKLGQLMEKFGRK